MKKAVFLLLILFVIPSVLALEDWFNNAQRLEMDILISSSLNIVEKTTDAYVNYVTANLSFFPRDNWRQQVDEISYTPQPTITDEVMQFRWEKPEERTLDFEVSAVVNTKKQFNEVNAKVDFPLKNIPEKIKVYTLPSENIDSNNEEIIKIASDLATGENDLYLVVSKIANWVKSNVKYDLNTLTEQASQKASWVLKERYGVCDEITTLFSAMLRAIGIPVKYIGGVAYTNWRNLDDWGPHAWSEVYFPGEGWVAFDITYGQFGYIDATHIALKESIDSSEASTRYEWSGREFDVQTNKLEIRTNLKKVIKMIKPPISIEANILKKQVKPGSYNLVEANIQNLKPHYVMTELDISRNDFIDTVGFEKKIIVLKPNENKKVFWTIKISDELKEGYIYTLPIIIYSQRNISGDSEFTSTSTDPKFSFEEIKAALDQMKEEEEKVYSRNIEIKCESDKKDFYSYERTTIECKIKNTGNIFLEGLEVCFSKSCEKEDLGISQQKKFEFLYKTDKLGKKELTVTAKNKDVSKADSFEVNVLDEPKIIINDFEYPAEIEFDNDYKIVFLLKKESLSQPHKVTVTLEKDDMKQSWEFDKLEANKRMIIDLNSKELDEDSNMFKIKVDYEDKNGKRFSAEEQFDVKLINVTFGQKIKIWLNKVNRKITSWFE